MGLSISFTVLLMRYSVIRRGIQLRPHLRFDPGPLWESPVSPATGRATDDLMSMEGKYI